MEFELFIALGGLVIGVLIGLTGMGGGALLTPFLILMGVQPVVAVGTDLAQMTVTKFFGAWQHQRQGSVDRRLVLFLALGSVPGALVGVGLLVFLRDVVGVSIDVLTTRFVGAMLVLVSLVMLLRLRYGPMVQAAGVNGLVHLSPARKLLRPVLGFGIGLLVGISSVGSGTLFLVALTLLFRMRMLKVVGTDIFHAAILTAAAGLAHIGAGNVDFVLAGNILIGTIPGVLLGSRMGVRLPDKGLASVVAVAMLVAGVKIL